MAYAVFGQFFPLDFTGARDTLCFLLFLLLCAQFCSSKRCLRSVFFFLAFSKYGLLFCSNVCEASPFLFFSFALYEGVSIYVAPIPVAMVVLGVLSIGVFCLLRGFDLLDRF